MSDEELANCLSELGNSSRLKIFKTLVQAGEDGISVGDIQKKLGIASSTLSHHISKLSSVELLIKKRERTTLYCFANYKLLDKVVEALQESCCIDYKKRG